MPPTGGPAARSGDIRVGDYLLAINDVTVKGLSAAHIRSLIVGPDVSEPFSQFHNTLVSSLFCCSLAKHPYIIYSIFLVCSQYV